MTAHEPIPFFFGPESHPLFGWLHRAATDTHPGTGIVLCNPFGDEALSTHRTYRHLAQAAADAGFPALRFDYHGTGDSAGDDTEPGRVDAWLASIQHAVKAIQDQAGVEQVCLFGLRLGALLAAIAAPMLPEVTALILVAPVTSGRGLLRELRALSATSQQAGAIPSADTGTCEAAGFVITAETAAALATLNTSGMQRGEVTNVLVIDRGDMPVSQRLASELEARGMAVDRGSLADYARMMRDPHEALVPADLAERVTSWLRRCEPALATDKSQAPSPQRPTPALAQQARIPLKAGPAAEVHESAVSISSHGTLLNGMLSTPMACHADGDLGGAPVLVLLSAGATHRVGPARIYTSIARELAARGLAVLRLDIAGIGDSPPQPGAEENVVYPEGAIDNTVSALSFAAELPGAGPPLLAGICSGSYHSLKAAAIGPRLAGICVINPLTYAWRPGMSLADPEYRLVAEASRQRRKLLQIRSWMKVARGQVNIYASARTVALRLGTRFGYRLRDTARAVHWPLRDDLATELRAIAQRGTHMHFIFSDSDPGLTMLLEQGGRTVDRLQHGGQLEIDVIPNADHTFTPLAARRRLIALLCEKLTNQDRVLHQAMP